MNVQTRTALAQIHISGRLDFVQIRDDLYVYRMARQVDRNDQEGSMRLILAWGVPIDGPADDEVKQGFIDSRNLDRLTAGKGYRDTSHVMLKNGALEEAQRSGAALLNTQRHLYDETPFDTLRTDPTALERIWLVEDLDRHLTNHR